MYLKEFKQWFLKKLIVSNTHKYDAIVNAIVPIKRARLVYRNFGIVISLI